MRDVALVGAGYWGKNLARNFFALERLHTICDACESLLLTYKELYSGVFLEQEFQKVLANQEIQKVVIASPAPMHYSMVKEALLHGKDVFVEKPICLESAHAHELSSLAKTLGRTLMVGHLLHYHPCVEKMFALIDEGAIGSVRSIIANRTNLGAFRQEENALWNFSPHDISVILRILEGRMPLSVSCTGVSSVTEGVEDSNLSVLDFGDVKAHIFASWIHPYKEQRLTIVGSKGMLLFDDVAPWEKKLQLLSDYVSYDENGKPVPSEKNRSFVKVEQKEPLKEECLHFLSCCDLKKVPRTCGSEGARVVDVLSLLQESLSKGGAPVFSEKPSYFAHESACIDQGAVIGKDVTIWHFSHIMKGATVSEGCNIGQNVVISPSCSLGKRVKVQNNVSIYTGVTIEDDVFIGPSVVFTNIKNPRSPISRKEKYLKTRVEKGATIGANATILPGITIGAHSFIGAGAVVTKDVKPYALVVGNPSKQVGWMSEYGERLDLPLSSQSPVKETCFHTKATYVLRENKLSRVH